MQESGSDSGLLNENDTNQIASDLNESGSLVKTNLSPGRVVHRKKLITEINIHKEHHFHKLENYHLKVNWHTITNRN